MTEVEAILAALRDMDAYIGIDPEGKVVVSSAPDKPFTRAHLARMRLHKAELHRELVSIRLDFETISEVDLELVGTRTYVEHPSTKVLCLSFAVGDQPVQIWWPGEAPPADLVAAIAAGARAVAHSFQFDATVWDQFMVPLGWPAIPLSRWSCTAFRARLARLPASLEQAAAALGLPVQKDKVGKRFLRSLRRRDLDANPLTEEERERLAGYARQDVEVLRRDRPGAAGNAGRMAADLRTGRGDERGRHAGRLGGSREADHRPGRREPAAVARIQGADQR